MIKECVGVKGEEQKQHNPPLPCDAVKRDSEAMPQQQGNHDMIERGPQMVYNMKELNSWRQTWSLEEALHKTS